MLLFADALVALVGLGEIKVPIFMAGCAQQPAFALHFHHMAWLHLENAGKGGAARHHRLHQLVEQAFGAEIPLHCGVGKQHLQLRAKHQSLAGHRPVQGLDTEAIAHQIEAVLVAIKQGKTKFAAQLRQGRLEPLAQIQMQQDF